MKTVEASAKTREEAIRLALEELGVEMSDVDKIEILDEGSRGFLGLGMRPVKVRITVESLLDDAPARPAKGSQRPTRSEYTGRGDRPARGEQRDQVRRAGQRGEARQDRQQRPEQPREQRTEQRREDRAEQRREQRAEQRREQRTEQRHEQRVEQRQERGGGQDRTMRGEQRRNQHGDKSARQDGRDRNGGHRGRGGRDAKQRPAPSAQMDKTERQQDKEKEPLPVEPDAELDLESLNDSDLEVVPESAVPVDRAHEEESFEPISDAQGAEAAALLQEVIQKMGIEAEVQFARAEDGSARLNVVSQDGAILIGRKGRNLNALQYIINRMISRSDVAENTERLVVDVEGYIDRRRAALEKMARGLAEKAKAYRRNMRLKPMSPQERRIIHMVLQHDPDVRTFSMGESLYRSVVISPNNARPERARPQRYAGGGRGRTAARPWRQETEMDPGQFGD